MSAVDLGKVDLLVNEGLYSNRTDFIRTAIRSQLEKHTFEIQQTVNRQSFVIGVVSYSQSDLDKLSRNMGWMVSGSPEDLVKKYNALINSSNSLRW